MGNKKSIEVTWLYPETGFLKVRHHLSSSDKQPDKWFALTLLPYPGHRDCQGPTPYPKSPGQNLPLPRKAGYGHWHMQHGPGCPTRSRAQLAGILHKGQGESTSNSSSSCHQTPENKGQEPRPYCQSIYDNGAFMAEKSLGVIKVHSLCSIQL